MTIGIISTTQCVDVESPLASSEKVISKKQEITKNGSSTTPSQRMEAANLLEKVHNMIILKDGTIENLFNLLVLSTPRLTLNNLRDERDRLRAMRKLMIQIHPSNFPYNEDAPCLYEDVQYFLDNCCKSISKVDKSSLNSSRKKRERNNSSPRAVVESVIQFTVRQKWNFLDGYTRPLTPLSLTSGKLLAPLIAYQCINARGSIAHGKKPSLIYSWENASACNGLSVKEVFEKHGGVREISNLVEDIKVEIIQNGPVVSVTFIPTQNFADKHAKSIVGSRINKRHYCLIIGWKLTEFGEVWLVPNYAGTEILEVPFGQFKIDCTIIVPKDNFNNTTWQKGPHFDMDMSTVKGWLQLKSINFLLKSCEFEIFAGILGGLGINEAIQKKTRFVVRDQKRNAHSRTCNLIEVTWDQEKLMWRIAIIFCDNGANPRSED